MALIQCTKKLLDELEVDPKTEVNTSQLLGNWHANLIKIERRKCVLFTNDATLFSFLAPKLVKADFKNLASIFIDHLVINLIYEGLDSYKDVILKEYQDNLSFSKTSNRSVLGSMNDIAYSIKWRFHLDGGLEAVNYLELNKGLNRIPLKANKYNDAIECLQRQLGNK